MEENEHDEYICPLTLYYMENPVIASDGHIYEKDAIIKWYNQDVKHLSPMNRKVLDGKFVEKTELKKEIDDFLKKNNIKREKKDLVFDIEVFYISCPNCNSKLKIINKEHKFYRCGKPDCKQVITLLNSHENIEQSYIYNSNSNPYRIISNNITNYDNRIIRNTSVSNRSLRNNICNIM